MNIVLAGASGFIGRHLSAALLAAGHRVQPLSRRHGTDVNQLQSAQHWLPHLASADVVINVVGIIAEQPGQRFATLHTQAPCALFDACVQAGISRVIQISALGCDDSAFTPYHLSKLAADRHLRSLPLDWLVLRPSLVYGPGSASSAAFMQLARLPLLPLPNGGRQLVQPVHISDVVAAVQQALAQGVAGQSVDVVGPQPLSFADWLQTMRAARGQAPAPVLAIPPALLLALLRVGRHLNPVLQPDNLRMLLASRAANPEPLARLLGRPPLSPSPRLFFHAATQGESS
ncbi:NAD-dependent epimerase/dehydratase family protein [Vogesella sp. LIG4]|uniref:NAD-dependent epimerase/dehydratase family protein n=1 Tax=Vogesella sp. LIG4 TaxID=1192162 RepID=UPI00081F8889|nr:NAD-dependent epimerase/dehydratase family protein [Vogesella sp. LIG4]SCK13795.1 Nucleoside-diphosphate-sugar epimerase [Vogesella sp. LIG4]